MAMMLQRKIKCKFIGSSEYQPEGIPNDKFIPVIGYEYRKREQNKDGKIIWVEDMYFLVVTAKGKLTPLASFNCATMIDEQAEINGGTLAQLLNNITIIGKVLSEKITKDDSGWTGEKPDSES